jgi:hypothetical protein
MHKHSETDDVPITPDADQEKPVEMVRINPLIILVVAFAFIISLIIWGNYSWALTH